MGMLMAILRSYSIKSLQESLGILSQIDADSIVDSVGIIRKEIKARMEELEKDQPKLSKKEYQVRRKAKEKEMEGRDIPILCTEIINDKECKGLMLAFPRENDPKNNRFPDIIVWKCESCSFSKLEDI